MLQKYAEPYLKLPRVMLAWHLNKHRTGHKREFIMYSVLAKFTEMNFIESDSVIFRIIRSSVETAAIGALFCVSSVSL